MAQSNTEKLLAFADSLEWQPIESFQKKGGTYWLKEEGSTS